jgi:hypothetical protein
MVIVIDPAGSRMEGQRREPIEIGPARSSNATEARASFRGLRYAIYLGFLHHEQ